MEKCRGGPGELHCVFLEKAYDSMPWEELLSEKYVRMVQDMYEDRERVVKSVVGVTDGLKVGDQALALSPLLFAVVMDGLTDEVMQNSLLRLWSVMRIGSRWRYALE